MQAQYKTRNGRLTISTEANSPKELFKALAVITEVFDADRACGCCGSDLIRFQVRTVETFDHYELACGKCGARFEFGQHRTGASLFPKRRDDEGNLLPNRGWKIWNREENE